jgi:DNA ligase D-like protein (predicted ligase)
MMAAPAERPFDDPEYLFEPKWDGFRCLAFADRGDVALYTRTGRSVAAGYPEVVSLLARLPGDAVVDGELVVCDAGGVPRFQLMQQRNFGGLPPRQALDEFPVRFVAFDLCWRDGEDLRLLPLAERRARLERLDIPGVEATPVVEAEGVAFYESVVAMGFEGVVGKRLDSPYKPGIRSRAWRKAKMVIREEVVVLGFTAGTGGRGATFGALVVGQWDGTGFVHVGEVGTGFDDPTLRAIRSALDEIVIDAPAAAGAPQQPGVRWVEPCIVAVVEHRGWTMDQRLRAASFKGVVAGGDPQAVSLRSC